MNPKPFELLSITTGVTFIELWGLSGAPSGEAGDEKKWLWWDEGDRQTDRHTDRHTDRQMQYYQRSIHTQWCADSLPDADDILMFASWEVALETISPMSCWNACFRRDLLTGDVGRLSTGVEGGVTNDESPPWADSSSELTWGRERKVQWYLSWVVSCTSSMLVIALSSSSSSSSAVLRRHERAKWRTLTHTHTHSHAHTHSASTY